MTTREGRFKLHVLRSFSEGGSYPKKRFTLIELLVVIAIIAVLAGMLIPSLGQAKASAHRIQCVSQKKQAVIPLLMYAQDNGEYMLGPYPNILTDSAGRTCWGYLMHLGYLKTQGPEPVICPLVEQEYRVSSDKWRYSVFGVRRGLIPQTTASGMTDDIYPLNKVRNRLSAFILTVDTYFKAGQNDHKTSYMYYMQENGNHILAFGHQKKASLGYADGHAVCRDRKELDGNPDAMHVTDLGGLTGGWLPEAQYCR